MSKKNAKDDKSVTWEEIWKRISNPNENQEELYHLYGHCTDTKENYIKFYNIFLSSNIPYFYENMRLYAKAGELLGYVGGKSDNNVIADKILDILEQNKEWMGKESDPALKYRILDLCCDIFIAGKKEAIVYTAILYDLVKQFVEDEDFYDEDTLEHIVSEMNRKWFDADWLSNNLEDNLKCLKDAVKSPKEYVRVFASCFTEVLIDQSAKMEANKNRKAIVQKLVLAFVTGVIFGVLLTNVFFGPVGTISGSYDDKSMQGSEYEMGSVTPTVTPTPTEIPTPTSTPISTEIVTPTPTSQPIIGNDPDEDISAIGTSTEESGIRLNVEGKLAVDTRKLRIGAGDTYDEVATLQKGDVVVPMRRVREDDEMGGYWYEVQYTSDKFYSGTKYYIWLLDGDLGYE